MDKRQRAKERFLQARFFVGAVLFHVAIFLIFATKVVFDAVQSRNHTFKSEEGLVVGNPVPPSPKPPPIAPTRPDEFKGTTKTAEAPQGPKAPDIIKAMVRDMRPGVAVPIAPDGRALAVMGAGDVRPDIPRFGKFTKDQLAAIQRFTGDWVTVRPRDVGYAGLAADFTVYVGQPARGGDSLAFVRFGEDGRHIIGGSVPNLAEMLNRFSKGRIKARVQGQVLRLDSAEIYETKPPFIYLTGRSDFRLTDEEILNLRKYLLLGGCIWGDNALPGYRSRFDVAFRREMKRVIPDDDKPFERLPESHPIYGNGGFRLDGTPAGLNFARLPIEAIRLDGVEAIIYTANGYGAMWQVTLDDSLRQVDNAVMQRPEKEFWEYRKVFYRNLNEETLLRSYRLGYNIVLHLLLRYEAKLRGLPQT